jgi:hypothetical protein
MRIHRTHTVLAPWSTVAPVLAAERLAAVRIEPVLRQRKGALLLDLTLADGAALTVIPGVLVDPAVVIGRERDPLVWPAGAPGDDAFLAALAERVIPHLEHLVLSGERVVEHVVTFADAPAFAAARSAGAFGAAPLREALARLAPYRYAARFARARRVRIDAVDAVGGWAVLRERASVGVAPERRDPALCAWYGLPPEPPAGADVAIVDSDGSADERVVVRLGAEGPGRIDVVDPLPLDVAISFDPAEGPTVSSFVVERAFEPASRPAGVPGYVPFGGSAGRIALIVGRSDAARYAAADTDEANALAAALRAEGFDAYVAADPAQLAGADLIHLIGTREGGLARRVVESGRAARIPVAVHAHWEDAHLGGWWGVGVTRFCFEYGSDERDLARYLGLLRKHALALGGISADAPYAPPAAAIDDASAALRDAAVAFASTEEEAEAIRRLGRRGPIVVVPPLAAPPVTPVPIGRRVGSDPFVLVHAPIAPERNQLLVARACFDSAIPLVCAGPVVDAAYLERLREFGGPDLIVLGEPSAEEAAALRACAAVVVDAAWVGEGGSRLAAALLDGARVVVADRRRFAPGGFQPTAFDPADLGGLTRAIGEARDAALRRKPADPPVLEALAPNAVVRAIVEGYAALAVPVP